MKSLLKPAVAVVSGVLVFLAAQLLIEFAGWWFVGGAGFADPLMNAQRMGAAGALGLFTALMLGLRSRRRLA